MGGSAVSCVALRREMDCSLVTSLECVSSCDIVVAEAAPVQYVWYGRDVAVGSRVANVVGRVLARSACVFQDGNQPFLSSTYRVSPGSLADFYRTATEHLLRNDCQHRLVSLSNAVLAHGNRHIIFCHSIHHRPAAQAASTISKRNSSLGSLESSATLPW